MCENYYEAYSQGLAYLHHSISQLPNLMPLSEKLTSAFQAVSDQISKELSGRSLASLLDRTLYFF